MGEISDRTVGAGLLDRSPSRAGRDGARALDLQVRDPRLSLRRLDLVPGPRRALDPPLPVETRRAGAQRCDSDDCDQGPGPHAAKPNA